MPIIKIQWKPGALYAPTSERWQRLPDGSLLAEYEDQEELNFMLEQAEILKQMTFARLPMEIEDLKKAARVAVIANTGLELTNQQSQELIELLETLQTSVVQSTRLMGKRWEGYTGMSVDEAIERYKQKYGSKPPYYFIYLGPAAP